MQWNKTIPENGQFKILCMASEKKNECCMKLLNHCNLLLYAMHVLIKMEKSEGMWGKIGAVRELCGSGLPRSSQWFSPLAAPGIPKVTWTWLMWIFRLSCSRVRVGVGVVWHASGDSDVSN